MKTRTDYLDRKCSHREYYAQFVTAGVKSRVGRSIGVDRVLASKDANLNDIELAKWDNVFQTCPFPITSALEACGDYPTLAGLVCIAKEAAKQIQEDHASK